MILPAPPAAAQDETWVERAKRRTLEREAEGLAEPYRGIRINGSLTPGLFPLHSTGVSTEPVRAAALAFLATLSGQQRDRTTFPVASPEWRRWANQHSYQGRGVSFAEMTDAQRRAAFGLVKASLSAKGLRLSQDIMRLNHTLGELNDDNFVEFGQWLYRVTVMGEPSDTEPWGWKLNGHHLLVSYFVLGDQVVMSPAFFGSEPVVARTGAFAGTEILQKEQDRALAFMRGLTPAQREAATVSAAKDGNNNVGEAFRDNLDLEYAGLHATDLDPDQREELLALIGLYVGNLDDGHAAVKMAEVEEHIDETWFAWIGATSHDAVFYYRILSPVILIEFDHQRPANLRHLYPPVPNREHIHTVIRTPNGNDYGKDLLRQHLQQHEH